MKGHTPVSCADAHKVSGLVSGEVNVGGGGPRRISELLAWGDAEVIVDEA